MDSKQIPELMKITFDTSQAEDLQAALQHVEQDMNAFSRVVSSATNTMEFWQSNMKKIVTEAGTNQGYFKQSILVNKADAENVFAALQASNARQFGSEMSNKHDWMYDISMKEAPLVSGTIQRLIGAEALKLAKAEAQALGGDIWRDPSAAYPDRVRYFYPADNAASIKGSKKIAPFKGATDLSEIAWKQQQEKLAIEQEKEAQREANKIVKEENQRNKNRQKETEKANKIIDDQKKRAAREAEKKAKDIESQTADILGEDKQTKAKRAKEVDALNKIIDDQKKRAAKEAAQKAKDIESQTADILGEDKQIKAKRAKEIAAYNKIMEDQQKRADKERAKEQAENEKVLNNEKKRQAKLKEKEEAEEAKRLTRIINEARKEEVLAEKQEQKEILEAQKEKDKEKTDNERYRVSIGRSILGLLTVSVALLRRIAASALQTASNIQKTTTQAHNLGLDYNQVREYNLFDKAHGLPEGTTIGAVQAVQSKFGDITNLDEKAIETLARVMGSEVADLVTSGIGGEKPDVLLEKILDKYFEQFKKGKNSLGMDVGQEQARRELYTVLSSISPEIANLFAQMTEDYTSPNIGGFQNFEEWQHSVKLFGGSLDDAQATYTKEIAEKYNQIIASFDNLRTNFLARLATSLNGIITWLSNFRLGMSESESRELDAINKQKNAQLAVELNTAMTANKKGAINAIRQINEQELPFDETTKGIKIGKTAAVPPIETIAGYVSGKYDDSYLLEHWQTLGLPSKSKDHLNKWKKRIDAIITKAMAGGGGEFRDSLLSYLFESEAMDKIATENAKMIGEGIDLVTYSASQEATEIKESGSFVKLFNKSNKWSDLSSGVQAALSGEIINAWKNEIEPNEAYNLITKKSSKDERLGNIRRSALSRWEIAERSKGSKLTEDEKFNIYLDELLKNPSVIYDYASDLGINKKAKESLLNLANENLNIDSTDNLALAQLATMYVPKDKIDVTRAYAFNANTGFDTSGQATLTINFVQDDKTVGNVTVADPRFANVLSQERTLVIDPTGAITGFNER